MGVGIRSEHGRQLQLDLFGRNLSAKRSRHASGDLFELPLELDEQLHPVLLPVLDGRRQQGAHSRLQLSHIPQAVCQMSGWGCPHSAGVQVLLEYREISGVPQGISSLNRSRSRHSPKKSKSKSL